MIIIIIKENEKKNEYLDLARKQKNVREYERDCDTNHNLCTRNGPRKA